MKKVYILLSVFACLLSSPVLGGSMPPQEGGMLPEIILPVPQNQEHQDYLGLSDKGKFTIPQIKSKVVLVEIFSMYCPFCQADAPTVNEFYRKVESDRSLKNNIKLIGIGAGNSEFEVDVFRKKYNIQFPLFPDADFSIHKMCGEVRTPYFIGIKIDNGGTHKIFYSKLGSMENPDKFLDEIRRLSGL
jgi:thiol-disulfide isomerase/thioredoxin